MSGVAGDIIKSSIAEAGIGFVAGSAIEKLFASDGEGALTRGTAPMAAVKLTAQILVNSFVAYTGFDYLRRKGLLREPDPVHGAPFFLTFLAPQRSLVHRVAQLSKFVQSEVGGILQGSEPHVVQVGPPEPTAPTDKPAPTSAYNVFDDAM